MNHLEALAKEWLAWMGHIGQEASFDCRVARSFMRRLKDSNDRSFGDVFFPWPLPAAGRS
jgi:hypothetical protein